MIPEMPFLRPASLDSIEADSADQSATIAPNLERETASDGMKTHCDRSKVELDPLLVTVPQAQKLLGICKTSVFDLVNKGLLERRKLGGATRITMRSVRKLAGL